MKYDVNYNCGHTGVVELFGKGKEREGHIAWLERWGECPECKRKRLAAEYNDVEVKMHYSRYKNEFSDCKKKYNSYDCRDNTIIVYVPVDRAQEFISGDAETEQETVETVETVESGENKVSEIENSASEQEKEAEVEAEVEAEENQQIDQPSDSNNTEDVVKTEQFEEVDAGLYFQRENPSAYTPYVFKSDDGERTYCFFKCRAKDIRPDSKTYGSFINCVYMLVDEFQQNDIVFFTDFIPKTKEEFDIFKKWSNENPDSVHIAYRDIFVEVLKYPKLNDNQKEERLRQIFDMPKEKNQWETEDIIDTLQEAVYYGMINLKFSIDDFKKLPETYIKEHAICFSEFWNKNAFPLKMKDEKYCLNRGFFENLTHEEIEKVLNK